MWQFDSARDNRICNKCRRELTILSKSRFIRITFRVQSFTLFNLQWSNRLVSSDMKFFRPISQAKITYRGFSSWITRTDPERKAMPRYCRFPKHAASIVCLSHSTTHTISATVLWIVQFPASASDRQLNNYCHYVSVLKSIRDER